eukprot:g13431.t1
MAQFIPRLTWAELGDRARIRADSGRQVWDWEISTSVWPQASGLDRRELGCAEKYQKQVSPGAREMVSAAQHLEEGRFEAGAACAERALGLFREAEGESAAIVDACRLVVYARQTQGRLKDAHELLEAFAASDALAKERIDVNRCLVERSSGWGSLGPTNEDASCWQARMLLLLSQINHDKRGRRNRERAKEWASAARSAFAELGETRLEAQALLSLMNILDLPIGSLLADAPEEYRRPAKRAKVADPNAIVIPREHTAEIAQLLAATASERTLRVLSWNIDGLDEVGGGQALALRVLAVAKHIARERPLAVLLQEVIPPALELLSSDKVLGAAYEVLVPKDPPLPYYVAMLVDKRVKWGEVETVPFPKSQMGRQLLLVKVREVQKELGDDAAAFSDVWSFCGSPESDRWTWDTTANSNIGANFACKSRFDRMLFISPGVSDVKGASGLTAKAKAKASKPGDGWQPKSIRLLGKEKIAGLHRFPSDHWGLLTEWTVAPEEAPKPTPKPPAPSASGQQATLSFAKLPVSASKDQKVTIDLDA